MLWQDKELILDFYKDRVGGNYKNMNQQSTATDIFHIGHPLCKMTLSDMMQSEAGVLQAKSLCDA